MDLTDRYLGAIRANLPQGQADDIIAELKDTLISRREEREAELGRKLSEDETEALLKAFGHPLMVASRYQRRQYLIGPEVYPFYVFVLRMVLVIVGAVLLTLAIAGVIFSYGDPGQVIARSLGAIWQGGVITTGAVTILFAIFERYVPAGALYARWRPKSLPVIQDKPKSKWEHLSGLTAGAVFILWWLGVIHFPHVVSAHNGVRIDIEPAAIWARMFWPILGVSVLGMVAHLVALAWPSWLKTRAFVNLACGVAVLTVLAIIYRAGHWADVTGAGVPAAKLAQVAYGVDIGARVTLICVGGVWVFQCLQEIWRVWKARPRLGVVV